MTKVECGTIMMQEGLAMPPEIDVRPESYSPGWRILPGANGYALDRRLRLVGWGCFSLIGDLRTVSFGSTRAIRLQRAMVRMLGKVGALNFNCAEVTSVKRSRFLGIPYTVVHGHPRHIQEGSQLSSLRERNQKQKNLE
jgi:hypothetical protein